MTDIPSDIAETAAALGMDVPAPVEEAPPAETVPEPVTAPETETPQEDATEPVEEAPAPPVEESAPVEPSPPTELGAVAADVPAASEGDPKVHYLATLLRQCADFVERNF